MDGVLHQSQVNMDYCNQLIREYTVLDSAQIFGLLKNVGGIKKKPRQRIVKGLYLRGLAREIRYNGRSYYAKAPGILPTGKYHAQIICFWILLDYISKVDSHHATGTFSRISMEIEGRDYDIVYVKKGAERLCIANLKHNREMRYFVVVEDVSQIPLIQSDKIHTFATVSSDGKIKYYAMK